MQEVKTSKTGQVLWAVAGALLFVVWLASMALDDDRLCSSVPLVFGFAALLVLAVGCMLAGIRPARPSCTCLFGLAAGAYFLIRCLAGDMLSEIWRELPLILGSFVFYGAGYLVAQRRGGRAFTVALALALVANVACFFLLRETSMSVEMMGRPSMSLAGANSRACTLFTYKNFSAMFLMTAGAVLICRPLWVGWQRGISLPFILLGIVGLACSFHCESRAGAGLLPLLMLSGWVLWAIIRLYTGREGGTGVVVSGLLLFVGMGVALGELFMGNSLLQQIVAVDTHGRTGLWQEVYALLPQLPWYGRGAGTVPWHLIPTFTDYALPNYAHNDYLQAWADYGVVGILLLVAVLMVHLAAGFWSLASEYVDRDRRALVAACMLILLSFAGCAVFDFIWHNVGLAALTAFACGVLASPVPSRREPWYSRRKWAPGCGPGLRPVRPMGRSLTALSCVFCLMLAAGCAWFGGRLFPAWKAQWEYNALCRNGAADAQRVEFLERVMPLYPDPELVDHYVTLHPPAERADNAARKEEMLRMALRSNPHQIFTVVMLADVLGRDGRYAEAEALMRDNFAPGGQPRSAFANWPGYYGMNLLQWGSQKLAQGDLPTALSMMEYALNMWSHTGSFLYKSANAGGTADIRNKAVNAYIAARRVDVDMLHAIGVQKDDSWKQPLRPGGAPALYERWGNEPQACRYPDPYSRRSPLKF